MKLSENIMIYITPEGPVCRAKTEPPAAYAETALRRRRQPASAAPITSSAGSEPRFSTDQPLRRHQRAGGEGRRATSRRR